MQLMIINNKSGNSTVLNALLTQVKPFFESVVVVTPKCNEQSQLKEFDDVLIKELSKGDLIISSLISMKMIIFSREIHQDFLRAKNKGLFSLKYLEQYARFLVKGNALTIASIQMMKQNRSQNVVLSTWFAENAYAAASLKKNNPKLMTYSYAHSYEIDKRKNPYVGLFLDSVKDQYLDKIFFISNNVMKEFLKDNSKIISYKDKYIPLHFGSEKKFEGLSKISEDGVFRIVTCSGVSKVKRLDLIIEALKLYQGKKIEWVHLGSGDLFNEIKKKVNQFNNTAVCIKLLGHYDNVQVHEYYATKRVDLFLNVSSSEGLPVSIMEAMSYGIPALATDVGGNSEIVNKKTGWLVPETITPKELSTLLMRISSDNSACSLRDTAYEMWHENFRIDQNIKLLVEHMK